MTLGDSVEHDGREYRLAIEMRVGDVWMFASPRDITDDLLRRLLWSMPIPRGVHMTFDLAQSGQKGGE